MPRKKTVESTLDTVTLSREYLESLTDRAGRNVGALSNVRDMILYRVGKGLFEANSAEEVIQYISNRIGAES